MPSFFEYINSYMNVYFGIRLPSHAIVIAVLIGILVLFFLWFYCLSALLLWFRLWRLIKNLKVFKTNDKLEYPTELFKQISLFKHLWAEYQETLHEQRIFNPQTGIEEIVAIRATTPAEVFFGQTILVDSQLHTEFFKHLPGILTGLGIIGTFLGLIHGLQAFKIDENTEIVRQSLDQLLHGVYSFPIQIVKYLNTNLSY